MFVVYRTGLLAKKISRPQMFFLREESNVNVQVECVVLDSDSLREMGDVLSTKKCKV